MFHWRPGDGAAMGYYHGNRWSFFHFLFAKVLRRPVFVISIVHVKNSLGQSLPRCFMVLVYLFALICEHHSILFNCFFRIINLLASGLLVAINRNPHTDSGSLSWNLKMHHQWMVSSGFGLKMVDFPLPC